MAETVPVLQGLLSYPIGRWTPQPTPPDVEAIKTYAGLIKDVDALMNDVRTGAASAWTASQSAYAHMLAAGADSEMAAAQFANARGDFFQTLTSQTAKNIADLRYSVLPENVKTEHATVMQTYAGPMNSAFTSANSPLQQTLRSTNFSDPRQLESLRGELERVVTAPAAETVRLVGVLPDSRRAAYSLQADDELRSLIYSQANANPAFAPGAPARRVLDEVVQNKVSAPLTAAVGNDTRTRTVLFQDQAKQEQEALIDFAARNLQGGGGVAGLVRGYANTYGSIIEGGPAAVGASMNDVPIPAELRQTREELNSLLQSAKGGPDRLLAARANFVEAIPNFPTWYEAMGFSGLGAAAVYGKNHINELVAYKRWLDEDPSLANDSMALRERIIQERNRVGKGYHVTGLGRLLGGLVPRGVVQRLGRDNAAGGPDDTSATDRAYRGDSAPGSVGAAIGQALDQADEGLPEAEAPPSPAGAPGRAQEAPETPEATRTPPVTPGPAQAATATPAGSPARTRSGQVVQPLSDGSFQVVYDPLGGSGRVVTQRDLDYEGLARSIGGVAGEALQRTPNAPSVPDINAPVEPGPSAPPPGGPPLEAASPRVRMEPIPPAPMSVEPIEEVPANASPVIPADAYSKAPSDVLRNRLAAWMRKGRAEVV